MRKDVVIGRLLWWVVFVLLIVLSALALAKSMEAIGSS